MPDQPISALPVAATVNPVDLVPIVQAGVTKRATVNQFGGGLGILNLKDYGAKGDGVTDDTTAIQNWLNALSVGRTFGFMPPGQYIFKSALQTSGTSVAIVGCGRYTSVFLYAGSNTNIDLITIGTGINGQADWTLRDWGVNSTTQMTGGYALRLKALSRSMLTNIQVQGADIAPLTIWHGVFFDQVDTTHWIGIDVQAKHDGITVVGGSLGAAGLFLSSGRVLDCGGVGILVRGGYGGFAMTHMDVIANLTNFQVDNGLTAQPNREFFIGNGVSFDSATATNVLIDPTSSPNLIMHFTGVWFAGANFAGTGTTYDTILLTPNCGAGCNFMFTGCNIEHGSRDGLRNSSTGSMVEITGGWVKYNDGFGINCIGAAAIANTKLYGVVVNTNTAGNLSGVTASGATNTVF